MPSKGKKGHYNSSKSTRSTELLTKPSKLILKTQKESQLTHSWLLKISVVLLLLTYCLPRLYSYIDQQIDGKWTEHTPLKYIQHPHPDFYLTGEEIIASYGFNMERYEVTTEDGYINTMFRINKFTEAQLNSSRPMSSVLLIHGHLDSSDTWILNGHKSNAFILANAGYDVYMANTRGNKYSMAHSELDPKTSPEYWKNAIPDNQGIYDVPAFIEKIKVESHVESVSVIGHSMGSRMMLMNLEQNATYYSKNVNFLILLSPFAEIHSSSFINQIIMYGNVLIDNYRPDGFHIYRSFKNPGFITEGFKYVCGYADWYCNFWSLYMSHSTGEFNDNEKSKVFFSKYPGQSSFKAWQYVKQLMQSKKPSLYDFGLEENLLRYGQSSPPLMNLTKAGQAGVPISMFSMKHDMMLSVEESRKIKDALGDSVEYTELDGGHMTYMVAKDVSYMHKQVLVSLQQHNPLRLP